MLSGLARAATAAAQTTEWRWLFRLAQRLQAATVWARGGDMPFARALGPRLRGESGEEYGERLMGERP
jgi:hypothetical protein